VSPATREVLDEFHRVVKRAVETAIQAVTQKNEAAAHLVIDMKSEIKHLMSSAELHQSRRLVAAEPNRLPAYRIEMDILQSFRRIYYFAKRMARGVVPDLEVEESN
jgi:phosphate:Na+ symporter